MLCYILTFFFSFCGLIKGIIEFLGAMTTFFVVLYKEFGISPYDTRVMASTSSYFTSSADPYTTVTGRNIGNLSYFHTFFYGNFFP